MPSHTAHTLFSGPCDFVLGAAELEQVPPSDLPEIAFIGRSNVGKSSLINALTGRKTLARTSNTPGRTQQLNFFNLGDRLMLVDLPGYGYARVSKQERVAWGRLIDGYLLGRSQLQRVCLLVDARHGIKPSDIEMMEMLDKDAVSYQLILTKADKCKQVELERREEEIAAIRGNHPAMHPQSLVTSATKRKGIDELRHALYEMSNRK